MTQFSTQLHNQVTEISREHLYKATHQNAGNLALLGTKLILKQSNHDSMVWHENRHTDNTE